MEYDFMTFVSFARSQHMALASDQRQSNDTARSSYLHEYVLHHHTTLMLHNNIALVVMTCCATMTPTFTLWVYKARGTQDSGRNLFIVARFNHMFRYHSLRVLFLVWNTDSTTLGLFRGSLTLPLLHVDSLFISTAR